MSYKYFDFECTNRDCPTHKPKSKTGPYILADHLWDEGNEPAPVCPHCDEPLTKKVGTAWARHVSWSTWRIGQAD